MNARSHALLSSLLLVFASSLPGEEAKLAITDAAGKRHEIPAFNFSKLARRKVEVAEKDQANVEFEGALLVDLLESVGVVFGKDLRGARTSEVVVIEATDGYRVVISLLEIDPATGNQT